MANDYQNKDGKLEVTTPQDPVVQEFTLEQIDDMIANTEADKERHEAGVETATEALVELNVLKAKAEELGVEPVVVPEPVEPDVVELS